MNILLTGAGGFVGQQVLNSLLQTDNNISLVLRTGADLTPYKREPNIKSIIRWSTKKYIGLNLPNRKESLF